MIEELPRPASDDDLRHLGVLLLDAVAAGASVGFLDALTLDDAVSWWRARLDAIGTRAIVVVARDDDGIIGTVQVIPASMPNQQHRGEVAKLLVHRRARGRGVGKALMNDVESRARAAGFTLLTLDTKRGDVAEGLYRRSGWTEVGVIPNYALDPDGSFCDTVVFYKSLS